MRTMIVRVRIQSVEDACKTHVTDYCQGIVGMPSDAKLVDASYDMQHREIRLCFEHESFYNVPDGHKIPFFETMVATNYYHVPEPQYPRTMGGNAIGLNGKTLVGGKPIPWKAESICTRCNLPIVWTTRRWYHVGAPNPPVYDELCHNKQCDDWRPSEDMIQSCQKWELFNIFKCEKAILEKDVSPF